MAGDELDTFINGLLEDKQLPGLTEDVRAQLLIDLKKRLLNQIDRAVVDALPPEKLDGFNQLLDMPGVDDEQIHRFIRESGVDIKKVTLHTMLRFRDLYLQTPEERARP